MRALIVAALVFVAALAGCSGKKSDELHYECLDGTEIHEDDYEGVLAGNASEQQVLDFLKTKCPKNATNGNLPKTNTTTQAPNKLPVLKLKVSDFAGNSTNVTTKNGNLTFDATGSFDPDGSITAIAVSVQDSNATRTLPLYDLATKKFKTANFKFDRAGPVNVSVAMVDDRAGFATNLTKVFVNDPQHLGGADISLPVGSLPLPSGADACKGSNQGAQSPIIDAYYFKLITFTVQPGVQYVEAIPGEDNIITICDWDGNAVSATKQTGTTLTTAAGDLPLPPGTKNYGIGIYAGGPQTAVDVDVIVHYDAKPAA